MHTADTAPGHMGALDQDEVALLRRVAARDPQAFEQLYQRYTPRLTSYLRTLLGSREPVEDVLHDVWLVVWHQATRYQATGPVSSWLFGIARHKARKARARVTRSLAPLPATRAPADAADPAHCLSRQDQARLVQQALALLPPVQREVVTLTYLYSYPAQAIAAFQDCSLATVRYRLQQARRHLAATLAAWELAPCVPGVPAAPAPAGAGAAGHGATPHCDLAHTF